MWSWRKAEDLTSWLDYGHSVEQIRQEPVPIVLGGSARHKHVLDVVDGGTAEQASRAPSWLIYFQSLISEIVRTQEFQMESQFLCILGSVDVLNDRVWTPCQSMELYNKVSHP